MPFSEEDKKQCITSKWDKMDQQLIDSAIKTVA